MYTVDIKNKITKAVASTQVQGCGTKGRKGRSVGSGYSLPTGKSKGYRESEGGDRESGRGLYCSIKRIFLYCDLKWHILVNSEVINLKFVFIQKL